MPLEIQSHTIPHLKALISGKMEPRGLRWGSTFRVCQTLFKSAYLLHKEAYRADLFASHCTSQFKSEFEQLFGEILWRSYCSVIRTSILELALALASAGLPLNGFNFDKVGLKAASAEAVAEHDGENLVKTSE